MKNALRHIIEEDIGFEDITTNALIAPEISAHAEIISRVDGIIAGVNAAETICTEFGLKYSTYKSDGDLIHAGDVVMLIEGNARVLLSIERTVLNLMMRMSGIATLTAEMVKKAKSSNKNIIIAGTRKTTPGIQFFEKSAIKFGGGDPHRFRLDDCVMIKDNHRAMVGDIEQAIKMVKKNVSFTKKIEVEVECLEDAIIASKAGADIVMLDNMGPQDIEIILTELTNLNLRKNVIIEASGGITPDNIVQYARTGVDVISMGFITHSAPAIDLSLEISFNGINKEVIPE
jgi:nicotinate-nucleotide pyrophosphorylase (carboxylating)